MDAFNPISLKSKLPLAEELFPKTLLLSVLFSHPWLEKAVNLQVVRQFWHLGQLGQPYF